MIRIFNTYTFIDKDDVLAIFPTDWPFHVEREGYRAFLVRLKSMENGVYLYIKEPELEEFAKWVNNNLIKAPAPDYEEISVPIEEPIVREWIK